MRFFRVAPSLRACAAAARIVAWVGGEAGALEPAPLDVGIDLGAAAELSLPREGSPFAAATALHGVGEERARGEVLLRLRHRGLTVAASGRYEAQHPVAPAGDVVLGELFYEAAVRGNHFTVGKKVVVWDVGFGFRPLDVVQQEDRRALVPLALEGVPLVARQGVRVLHNDVVETHGLQLVGLDYMNADEATFDMHPSEDRRTIKSALAALPLKSGSPSLLMHHSPVGARYVAAKRIDLMTSGHTHAGQVFPFTALARLVFPLNRGLHREGATTVFVSQGAGTFVARVRVGTSNELNLLHLKPEAARR